MNFNSTPKTNTSSLVISPISGTPTTLVSPRHLGHPCRLAPGLTGIGTGRAELLLDSHQLIVLGLGRQRRRQRRRQRLRGRLVWTLDWLETLGDDLDVDVYIACFVIYYILVFWCVFCGHIYIYIHSAYIINYKNIVFSSLDLCSAGVYGYVSSACRYISVFLG